MPRTITALFNNVAQAASAVQALRSSGFSDDQASFITPNPAPSFTIVSREADDRHSRGELIATGALTGGLMAGLLSLIVAGPVLAAAGIGLITGGIAGGFVAFGFRATVAAFPDKDQHSGALVTLNTTPDRASEIRAILERHQPAMVSERPSVWRRQGWSPHEPSAPALFVVEEDSVVTRRVEVTRSPPPLHESPVVETPPERCDSQVYYERHFHP